MGPVNVAAEPPTVIDHPEVLPKFVISSLNLIVITLWAGSVNVIGYWLLAVFTGIS